MRLWSESSFDDDVLYLLPLLSAQDTTVSRVPDHETVSLKDVPKDIWSDLEYVDEYHPVWTFMPHEPSKYIDVPLYIAGEHHYGHIFHFSGGFRLLYTP